MVDKRAEREDRASRLRQARVNAGFATMADAIRECGWPKETYKAHESGRNGFDTAQARQYARRYKVSPAWLMTGIDSAEPEHVPVAPVIGEVAAGRWLNVDYHDESRWEPVPYVPGRFPDLQQSAYRVAGPSMNRLKIDDGDFLITVPYSEARGMPQNHDIVIVETHDAGKVERTCKELIVAAQSFELWPRSDHPSFQDPIVIPRTEPRKDGSFPVEADGKTVKLMALVIGRYRPFGSNY
jgi:SOS-response transcriptional repressor LexA